MAFCDYPIIGTEKNLPIYLINMGLQDCQDHIIRKEGYPCPQILFSTKGSGTLIYDNKIHSISGTTAFYLPADYPHEYYPNEEIWDIHWVVFGGEAIPQLLTNIDLSHPRIFTLPDTGRLEFLFLSMHEAIRSDSLLGNTKASGILYSFLLEFNIVVSQKKYGSLYHPIIVKAIDYINCNYQDSVTLEDLCALCGISKQYLCFLFRSSLHTRPTEYITKKRLQEAKGLLTTTNLSIEQIAEKCGFCSSSYFCKMFKRYESMTALQFRENAFSIRT